MPERNGIWYDSDDDLFDGIVEQEFGIGVFSYNSEISNDFWLVLQGVAESKCTHQIAKYWDLDRDYVELMQYIICNNNNAEYGTSPRCCWLTLKGAKVYQELKRIKDKQANDV